MRGHLALTAVTLTVLLSVAGCAGGVTTGSTGSADDTAPAEPGLQGSWHLVAARDSAGSLPSLPDYPVTLTVEADQVSGTAACNGYGGRLTIQDGDVRLSEIGATEMGCDSPVMELESRYLAALGTVERAEQSGDSLVLSGPDSVLEFSRDTPVRDALLTDGDWLVDTFFSGEVASSARQGSHLTFSPEGRLLGQTPCRRFVADYEVAGERLLVTGLTRGATVECGFVAAQDDQRVWALLQDESVITIDRDRLTLLAADGAGIGLMLGRE